MFRIVKFDFPEMVTSSIIEQLTKYINAVCFGVIRDL